MKRIYYIIILFALLVTCGSAEEALSVEYSKVENGHVCYIRNTSDKDVLIKDLKSTLGKMFGIKENPFNRGKEWTFLRSKGNGFTSDRITLFFSDKVTRGNAMYKVPLTIQLRVANLDKAQAKKSKWKTVEFKVVKRAKRQKTNK